MYTGEQTLKLMHMNITMTNESRQVRAHGLIAHDAKRIFGVDEGKN
jgi:hypothetical protein